MQYRWWIDVNEVQKTIDGHSSIMTLESSSIAVEDQQCFTYGFNWNGYPKSHHILSPFEATKSWGKSNAYPLWDTSIDIIESFSFWLHLQLNSFCRSHRDSYLPTRCFRFEWKVRSSFCWSLPWPSSWGFAGSPNDGFWCPSVRR